ncbi:hypothetical protein [Chengkuizengella sediminis]|uniref:hypothetical protein n=1 Tax=Chengkuizengella sediminis TaxID=1885917 RepID=UPI001389EDBD|nr:hypothetical protein [Chengkuizengella sediminis]NDI36208.1 hypothetical protein [Chengkuizengella sediminis]
MGHFDESICDCCVCPMQCVLEQLVGRENVGILTLTTDNSGTLLSVDNLIACLESDQFGTEGDIFKIPIHNICAVDILALIDFKLKPIRKSTGECSCTEEPTTNLAQSMIGELVQIVAGQFETFSDETRIIKVGEGIVVTSDGQNTSAVSSCKAERFGPPPSS